MDTGEIIAKVLGLTMMGLWFVTELKERILVKIGMKVWGRVLRIERNDDKTSRLNKIAFVEFIYNEKETILKHYFSSKLDDKDEPLEMMVSVNKKNPTRSVVLNSYKGLWTVNLLVPIIFSLLIILSFRC
jgi:hypothetical protein